MRIYVVRECNNAVRTLLLVSVGKEKVLLSFIFSNITIKLDKKNEVKLSSYQKDFNYLHRDRTRNAKMSSGWPTLDEHTRFNHVPPACYIAFLQKGGYIETVFAFNSRFQIV